MTEATKVRWEATIKEAGLEIGEAKFEGGEMIILVEVEESQLVPEGLDPEGHTCHENWWYTNTASMEMI